MGMGSRVFIPFLFVITDSDGSVIDYYGTESLYDYFEQNNIKKGTSFAMKHAGINATSLSMELQSVSVVVGGEHSNKLFTELSCVCTPVQITNVTIGYFGLCFHYFHEVKFSLLLIEHLAKNIEEKSSQKDPIIKKADLFTF